MKGLSSLERVVLESIGKEVLGYEEIKNQAGLMENVFHNVLQALIIRGLVAIDGTKYRIAEKISPLIIYRNLQSKLGTQYQAISESY